MDIKESFGFHEGESLILDFEELLKKYDIYVKKESDLEEKFLSVFDVLFHYENHNTEHDEERNRLLFKDFMALYDLALKVLNIKNHGSFKQLIPHLKKLNQCSIAQNSSSTITDQDANKIIELYIAALCMNICDDVFLDHPEVSLGDNPDIIAEINGRNWGFACKTIHTKNSQTIYENLVKAIDQIEKSVSIVGIPIINLKNIIDHNAIWPKEHTFSTLNEPLSILRSNIHSIIDSLERDIGTTELRKMFFGKKSLSGVLFIAQSSTSIYNLEMKSEIATRLNVMEIYQLGACDFEEEELHTLEKLNHYMQLAS